MAIIKLNFSRIKEFIKEREIAKMELACEVVEAEAKYLCPLKDGQLIGSFSHEVESSDREIIGRIKNSAGHAAYVEFGTPPHEIRPKDKKALAFQIGGKTIITKVVHHPGTQGIPFMRGAMISKKREVKEILELA